MIYPGGIEMQVEQCLPIVELRNVSFGFPGNQSKLLRNVSLKISAHETVLLTGDNGSGKSTLLGLLTGRWSPDEGSVRVFGRDPWRADRLPEVGPITEPFHPLYSPLPTRLSTRRLLTWLEIIDGVSAASARQALVQFGLSRALLDRPIAKLSKGERQRVMLMMAILRRPRLILADEPLEGIDLESRTIISRQLSIYAKSNESSVLWVSHHLAEAAQYADRVLHIDGGSVIALPKSQFTIIFQPADGERQVVTTPTLQVLPELVASKMNGSPSIRLEVSEGASR